MYEWLRDYQRLEQEIAYLDLNLEKNKKELGRWTLGDLSKYKLAQDSNGSQIEEIIFRIEYEIAHMMNDLFNTSKLIRTFKGLDNKILYGKYVEGKTLVDIADQLDFSLNYIYNKHAEIMRTIDYAVNHYGT